MDAAALRQLALEVSSDDIAVSRDATRKLQAFLTPSHVIGLLSDPATAEALSILAGEVEGAQNPDVYRVLGTILTEAFSHPAGSSRAVLYAPAARFLLDFIVRAAAASETAVAATMLECLKCILSDPSLDLEEASAVGQLLEAHFRNDRVLRLLNCDQIETPSNAQVCTFLDLHTSLLPFLLESTEDAFVNDPLLLANYLVASGVVCRTVAIPSALRQRTMQVLQTHDDPLYYAFVCRFWSIALHQHEDNGSHEAAACVTAVMPVVEESEKDEVATEAAFDLLAAAATTATGWDVVTSLLRCEGLQARLKGTSSSLRLSTLNLMYTMLTSSHVVPSFFTRDVLLDAWQTRTTPDDEVRLALWRVVLTALLFESLQKVLAAVCASFLCSGAHEENITVRTMKLQAADYLIRHASLPENVKTRLKQFIDRGLYPAGSSGVALMTKD